MTLQKKNPVLSSNQGQRKTPQGQTRGNTPQGGWPGGRAKENQRAGKKREATLLRCHSRKKVSFRKKGGLPRCGSQRPSRHPAHPQPSASKGQKCTYKRGAPRPSTNNPRHLIKKSKQKTQRRPQKKKQDQGMKTKEGISASGTSNPGSPQNPCYKRKSKKRPHQSFQKSLGIKKIQKKKGTHHLNPTRGGGQGKGGSSSQKRRGSKGGPHGPERENIRFSTVREGKGQAKGSFNQVTSIQQGAKNQTKGKGQTKVKVRQPTAQSKGGKQGGIQKTPPSVMSVWAMCERGAHSQKRGKVAPSGYSPLQSGRPKKGTKGKGFQGQRGGEGIQLRHSTSRGFHQKKKGGLKGIHRRSMIINDQ